MNSNFKKNHIIQQTYIDGMDYWIWKAVSIIEPQVVVCETANPIPPCNAWTVPYDPQFVCDSENYRGASLTAMCKLGCDKGYRLVGVHRIGFNVLFVMKNGVGENFPPAVNPESSLDDPFSELARKDRWPDAKWYKWQEVYERKNGAMVSRDTLLFLVLNAFCLW